jgi:hypothetical protein
MLRTILFGGDLMKLSRILAACLLVGGSLSAAVNKEHAVAPVGVVTITGVVRNSAGDPVAGAIVHSGTSYFGGNGTGRDGKYTLTLPGNRPTTVTVEDFAYETVTTPFTPQKDATLDLTMTSARPIVTVKLTSGETHVLDLGTSQFAYVLIFSGYARFDNANLCKPDGSAFTPAKTEIARIIGPATSVTFAKCCPNNTVMTANVEMKSGEKTQVFFNDSCAGNEVDFLGRERSTGQWGYYNFTNIAEIDFP